MPLRNGDYGDSDDSLLQEALNASMRDHSVNGRSRIAPNNAKQPMNDAFEKRVGLEQRSRALHHEIQSVDGEIEKLEALKHSLRDELNGISEELQQLKSRQPHASTSELHGISNEPSISRSRGRTNYFSKFDWSGELRKRLKRVFGIDEFRLCQEGVCNANMDNRDIVCVMPTGGGKSLTYQLPALLCPGATLVISPLISLITDQILHLQEAGIEACMLTGATPKDEVRSVMQRLTSRSKNRPPGEETQKEIKLVYVTPEKIAKSKAFMSMLQKLAGSGNLARIVIDEAHCVSQLGHDFRPDYKKLSILRQLFPDVPILALSATCPPKVLKDLLATLRMKAVVDGKSAPETGTVYFSAPLYRKNLHYTVVQKPASAPAVIQAMSDYILASHSGESGIIYCLSKKDTESVSAGLEEVSNGKIRAGVYHADVADSAKERLHKRWRSGEVQVVCATIAFGLGIDKGDVRFVLHHSMSKSLDGFYQESGRAGRDGKDSDCVLYFRGQDATRLSSLICGELEGQQKLHEMLKFAQEMEECRKLQFAKYFSASSSLSMAAWSTDGSENLSRCGHCDNCKRPPESIERKNVVLQAWQIVKVSQIIESEGGRVTLGMLSDLVRGAGGQSFGVGGSRSKEKNSLDLEAVASGKVEMNKDDVESLLITLLLSGYLKEEFSSTAYTINVYLCPGPHAFRLSRLSHEDILAGTGPEIIVSFPKKEKRRKSSLISKEKRTKSSLPVAPKTAKAASAKGKGKKTVYDEDDDIVEPDITKWVVGKPRDRSRVVGSDQTQSMRFGRGDTIPSKRKRVDSEVDSPSPPVGRDRGEEHDLSDFIDDDLPAVATDMADEEDESAEWSFSFGIADTRGAKKPSKRRRVSQDIIELSD